MKGKFLHNEILNGRIEQALRQLGAQVHREYRLNAGPHSCSVDLWATWEGYRIVSEAETSPPRVANDIAKAGELKADLLLIPVPNGRVAQAAERQLRKCPPESLPKNLRILILPFGAALRVVSNKSLLMSALNVGGTTRQQTPQTSTTNPNGAIDLERKSR